MALHTNPHTDKPSSHWLAASLLLITGFVVILLFSAHGTTDMDWHWLRWLELAHTLRPVDAYAAANSDYPPLTIAMLWLGGALFAGITADPVIQIKWTLLLILSISTFIYWRLSRSVLLTAVFLAAHVIGTIGLAYLDIFAGLWMVAAFLLLIRGVPEGFVVLLACALLTKWQPLIMMPVVVLYLLSQKNPRNFVALLLLPLALLVIANWFDLQQVLQAWLKLQRAIDGEAFNAYAFGLQGLVDAAVHISAIISSLQQPNDVLAEQRYQAIEAVIRIGTGTWSSARFWIFQGLFAFFYLYTLLGFARSKRQLNDLLRCSIQVYVVYFLFRHGVHENHLYMPALLALVLAARQQAYLRDAILLNLLHTINMFYYYGFEGHWPVSLGWLRHFNLPLIFLLAGLCCILLLRLWKRWLPPAPEAQYQPAQINST